MTHAWKRLSSGKYVDLNNLTLDDIDIDDINVALNGVVRFNGHYKDRPPLTVAQHTLLCERIRERIFPNDDKIKRAVIIHDFPETYYGDIATPVKKALGPAYKAWAAPIDALVEMKFWPSPEPISPEIHECVKICDLIALDIERRSMWESQYGKDKWPETPHVDMTVGMKQNLFRMVQSVDFVDLRKLLD